MTATLDFFREQALPTPRVPAEEAARITQQRFGITARLTPLGSQQDQNFLLLDPDTDRPIGVLKFANAAISLQEIEAQDRACDHLVAAIPGLRIATTLRDANGGKLLGELHTSSGRLATRVVRFLDGGTLRDHDHLNAAAIAALGELAARVSVALRDFDHPGLERVLQWDPRHADRVVEQLLPHLADRAGRDRVARATAAAWQAVSERCGELPVQPGHFDLTDENTVITTTDGNPTPDGVIDLGDLTRSWAVAELAITISSVLHHAGAEPASVLPAICAFDRVRPLAPAELDALWPLVVLRGAVLVTSSAQQVALDGDATHASAALAEEWAVFDQATAIPAPVMTALIADALGTPRPKPRLPRDTRLLELARDELAVLDLATESGAMDHGAWLDPGIEDRLARELLASPGIRAVVAPHAIPRLTASRPLSQTSPATVPTGLDLWLREPAELDTALDAGGLELKLECDGAQSGAGAPVLACPAAARVRISASAPGLEVPALVAPEYAAGWLAQCADPATILGLEVQREPEGTDLLARRQAAFAPVQEHYYARPPQIERGWRHHLIDVDGRVYLDMVNNVAILGHSHPGVERAATRQLRRLNTNSRFHYALVAEYSERLAALLPDPLDTVFLVNSGSEAVDLALRLAFAHTGRREVVAVREAYHGWTYASDAVSTSTADNPAALSTRPDWVQTVPAPNGYRGEHRGADAALYGPEAAAAIDELARSGRRPAAFLAETFYGNAGGMPLPDGYLEHVYGAVRRHGGLAIADEIQVGYGRLGEWFWGFEQQRVVPDIVAVAKAAGNGYPVGAVITSSEIAASYRRQGYFFSSTGGSPVACAIGLAVLDAIAAERLQENAREVGAHLRARLSELIDRHELIGAVHGTGLYLGVELVRDRRTLEPAAAETDAICARMLELGVVIQPTGDRGCVLKTKPPLCLDREGADFFVQALDRVLSEGW